MANPVSHISGIPNPTPKTNAPVALPKQSVSQLRSKLFEQQPTTTTTTTMVTRSTKVASSSNGSVARLAQHLTSESSKPTPQHAVSTGKRFVAPEKFAKDIDPVALFIAAGEEVRTVLGAKGRLKDADQRGVVTLEEVEQSRKNPRSQPSIKPRQDKEAVKKAQEEEDLKLAIKLSEKMQQEEDDRKFAEQLANSQ